MVSYVMAHFSLLNPNSNLSMLLDACLGDSDYKSSKTKASYKNLRNYDQTPITFGLLLSICVLCM